MNEETTTEEMTAEDAKASLGLSTRLSEGMLMRQTQEQAMMQEGQSEATEAPQEGVTPPVEESPQEDNSAQLEGKMDEKLEILRTEMKDTIKLEIEGIRNTIKEALDEQED